MTTRQRQAFTAVLEARYAGLLAEQLFAKVAEAFRDAPDQEKLIALQPAGEPLIEAVGTYEAAKRAVEALGVNLSEEMVSGPSLFVDVRYSGFGVDFTYRGVAVSDHWDRTIVVNSGDIEADFREAILRCQSHNIMLSSSVHHVLPDSATEHTTLLMFVADPALGELIAYCGPYSAVSHKTEEVNLQRGEGVAS